MKKLFLSFFTLIAISFSFVSCEKEPEIKSNCYAYSSQFMKDEDGAMYVFEFLTSDLDIETLTGNGEDIIIMMYAQPQEDGFPAAKIYDVASFEDFANSSEDCIIEGYPLSSEYIIGTYAYVIENDKATDILLCTGGNIEFKGNATNGTMIANLEFMSVVTEETITKEYIYKGAFNMEEKNENSPARAIKKLNK